jgi:hypothetical protein
MIAGTALTWPNAIGVICNLVAENRENQQSERLL